MGHCSAWRIVHSPSASKIRDYPPVGTSVRVAAAASPCPHPGHTGPAILTLAGVRPARLDLLPPPLVVLHLPLQVTPVVILSLLLAVAAGLAIRVGMHSMQICDDPAVFVAVWVAASTARAVPYVVHHLAASFCF